MSADIARLRVLLVGLWRHLSLRRRWQFVLVFGLVLLSAGAEVMTLGAVLPFIGILTAPERVYSYPLISTFTEQFGITATGFGSSVRDGHPESVGDKRRCLCRVDRPADDASAERVEHDTAVEFAFAGAVFGDVGDPQSVRFAAGKLPLDEI